MTARVTRVAVLALAIGGPFGALSFAQVPAAPRPRIAIVDEPTGAAMVILEAVGALPFPLAVRVDVGDGDLPDARWAEFAQHQASVWLAMSVPRSSEEIEPWRARVRELIARRGDALTVLEIDVDREPVAVARFAAQIAAIEAGVSHPAIRIALGGAAMNDPLRRTDIYTPDVAPYVDLLATAGRDAGEAATWLTSVDSQARLAPGPVAPSTGSVAGSGFLAETLADLGSSREISAWRSEDLTAARLRALAPLATLLTHHISLIDDPGARLSVRQNGHDVSASQRHLLAFDADTFSTYFAYWSDSAGDPLTVSLAVPGRGAPRLYDWTLAQPRRSRGPLWTRRLGSCGSCCL